MNIQNSGRLAALLDSLPTENGCIITRIEIMPAPVRQ